MSHTEIVDERENTMGMSRQSLLRMERRKSLNQNYRFRFKDQKRLQVVADEKLRELNKQRDESTSCLLSLVLARTTSTESQQTAPVCDECSIAPAVSFCPSCSANFCQECCQRVHSARVLSTHRPVPITQRVDTERCSTHPESKAELYCVTCDQLICTACILTSTHKEHNVESIPEAIARGHKLVSTAIDYIQHVISTKLTQIEDSVQTNSDLIRARFKELHHALDMRSQVLLEDTKSKAQSEMKKLKSHEANLASFSQKLEDTQTQNLKAISESDQKGTTRTVPKLKLTDEQLKIIHSLGGLSVLGMVNVAEEESSLKLIIDSELRCQMQDDMVFTLGRYGTVYNDGRAFGDFKFDSQKKGSTVEVDVNGLIASFTGDQGVLGDTSIPQSKLVYYEVTIQETVTPEANVYVGIACNGIDLNTNVGSSTGLSYRVITGDKWIKGVRSTYGTKGAAAGTVIGVKIDMRKQNSTVQFYHNGKCQGVAFEKISGPDWYPLFGGSHCKLSLVCNPAVPL